METRIILFAVAGYAAWCTQSALAREISSLVVDRRSGVATVVFTAGESGDNHALYYVWSNDSADRGAAIAAWPNVIRIGRVGDDDTSVAFELPAAAKVTGCYAARAFLDSSSMQYDYLVDYVKTGGTSGGYINTGVKPNKTTAAVVDAAWRATTTSARKNTTLFGAAHSTSYDTLFAFNVYINSTATYFASACCDHKGDWKASGLAPDTNRHVFHLDAATGKLDIYTDGVLVDTTLHDTENITMESSSWPMMLFARGHGTYNNAADQNSSAAIYSCIISNNNAIVRNYRPCVYGGRAGMYDSVNNKFYGSVNEVELIAEGTNTTYFVAEGDMIVTTSPVWVKGGFIMSVR